MQSLNGVYINRVRIDPATPVHLKLGDEVCFGIIIPKNELRYTLARREDGTHELQRVGPESGEKSDVAPNRDTTPLQSPKAKRLCPEGSISTSVSAPDTGTSTHTATSGPPHPPRPGSGLPASVIRVGKTTSKPPPEPSPTPPPSTTPSVSACVQKTPTSASVENELFPDGAPLLEDTLSEAIFGEAGALPRTTTSTRERRGLDATTIQIQAAKEEMDKEKQKLLSNIEALKSELTAKEELLAEQTKLDKEGIMNSMQEEFTCVICQELFVSAYTIPCSHSFCELCIKEWMKSKRKKDCPICRKTITSEPVRSLALDNAIDKMVEKMDSGAREERQKLKESYSESLKKFEPASVAGPSGTSSRIRGGMMDTLAAADALGVLTRSRAARGGVAVAAGRGGHGRHLGTGTADAPIIVPSVTPPRPTHPTHLPGSSVISIPAIHLPGVSISGASGVGVLRVPEESSTDDSDDSEEEEDDENTTSSEESDSYDSGVRGYFYGGYGRCLKCGESSVS